MCPSIINKTGTKGVIITIIAIVSCVWDADHAHWWSVGSAMHVRFLSSEYPTWMGRSGRHRPTAHGEQHPIG